MKFFLTILMFICLTVFTVIAQKAPVKKAVQKQPCAEAQNQHEMNRCAQEEYQKVDAELNKVYQQLLPKLETAHKDKLKAAQRAWIAFRDAHCDCEAFTFEGGSMQPLIQFSCLDQVTRERTKQLRGLLNEAGSK